MSAHPTGFLPHPMASAIGFHMAITTGDNTTFPAGVTRSLPNLDRDSALPSFTNAAEAGDTICASNRPAS
jgi:hypothetical protein